MNIEEENIAIHLKDVGIRYGTTVALEHVNLQIRKGRITAFVGPSGSGKTSLLKSLNRLSDLEKDCVVEGEVIVEGFGDLNAEKIDLVSLRRSVGMIFQKPNPFPISIRKNFFLPLRERGIKDKKESDRRMEKALKRVGLWDEVHDRLNERADRLSGGQQQRLCIARALVLEPDILLFDEPCSALDPMATEVVEGLISELRGELTVIIVTHNLAQAKRIADEVAVFWCAGSCKNIVEFGCVSQVFDAPQSDFASQYLSGQRG